VKSPTPSCVLPIASNGLADDDERARSRRHTRRPLLNRPAFADELMRRGRPDERPLKDRRSTVAVLSQSIQAALSATRAATVR
jgi:hypothetical protein